MRHARARFLAGPHPYLCAVALALIMAVAQPSLAQFSGSGRVAWKAGVLAPRGAQPRQQSGWRQRAGAVAQRAQAWKQRALSRLPRPLSRLGQGLRSMAGRVGDRLVRLRGAEARLARVERLWQRGEMVRGLGILRRTLKSKRLSDKQRARAFLYTGCIQSRLGNIGQAMRAFSGVLHLQPDFTLPAGTDKEIAANFRGAQGLRLTTSMRGENFSAELPWGKPSLLNRLRHAKETLAAKAERFVVSRPRLLSAYAHTLGRVNVWRAVNTLQADGIPRFKVHLEPDGKDPESGGRAHFNGDVYLDHAGVLSYRRALHGLAHEAYHLNYPISATAEYGKSVDRWNQLADRVASIRQAGAGLSKQTPSGRAERSKLARQLSQARREMNQLRQTFNDFHVHEEGLAEQYAGQIFGRANLPLSRAVWSISVTTPDARHPHPTDQKDFFLNGAHQGIHEYAGLKPIQLPGQ